MAESKTVTSNLVDIYAQQLQDVANMRTSLLAFDRTDPLAAKKALQNVTILRIHHQLSRIVRYTEVMDKLEDKLYSAMDHTIDELDEYDENTWKVLMTMQSRLQTAMIESHKLLEPYLNMESLAVVDVPATEDPQDSFAAMILNQESREKLRTQAQAVIAMLSEGDKSEE